MTRAILIFAFMGMLVTDVTAADKARTIQFSGHRWQVKQSDRPVGPGPNWFSGREENVWVDEKGRLHLRISQREGHWWCAEVYTDKNLGYGTYVFRIAGKLHELDKSAVLGLFTWDDNTFLNAANSEIDIEFARWGDPAQKILQYTVHPTRGPEVDPGEKTYRERWFEAEAKVTDEVSTHTFTWARDLVRFASYEGVDYPSPRVIAQWEYSGKQPVRRAKEGLKTSNPVGIPRPGRETKARLNLWLADLNGDGAGDAPSDGKDIEVIIEKFEFFRSK